MNIYRHRRRAFFCRGLAVLLCVILAGLLAFAVPAAAASGCGIIVIEASSGRVLYQQNADTRLPMASTTKIMTAMLTLEQDNLDEWFTVDSKAVMVEGSSMGLQVGDQATLRALCVGMLLPSGNDAANAAAVRISGSIPAFVDRMNIRAEQLGLYNTSFETPSGLDGEHHYSTARDMAILTAHALQNPDFVAICSQTHITVEFGNPPGPVILYNHNRLLSRYEGAIGVKTGFTKKAGRCLVSAAERDGVTLICVTLGVYDDWNVHARLYDECFAMITPTEQPSRVMPSRLPVTGGEEDYVPIKQTEIPVLPLLEGEYAAEEQLFLPPFLYAPVEAGETVGWIRYLLDGKEVERVPIVTAGTVIRSIPAPKSFWEQLFG